MAKEVDPASRQAVLRFYRGELRDRYALDNVRRFEEFSSISDAQIVDLREFFLQQIYPEPEERQRLDDAFDRLSLMLRSPKRMQPLVGAALSSLWRMGTRLPAAISAGRSTIDAYVKTRQLEQIMIDEALRLGFKSADFRSRERMVQLINAVPDEQVLELVNDIMSLFHALSNTEMLNVAVSFMKSCVQVMEKRKDLYNADDLEGVRLGLDLLEQGLALFLDVDKQHFKLLIDGIRRVEVDWFERIKAEAQAAAGA